MVCFKTIGGMAPTRFITRLLLPLFVSQASIAVWTVGRRFSHNRNLLVVGHFRIRPEAASPPSKNTEVPTMATVPHTVRKRPLNDIRTRPRPGGIHISHLLRILFTYTSRT